MGEKLLTRREVADMLRISIASLDRMVMAGDLKVIRLHGDSKRGRVLFKLCEIDMFIRSHSFVGKEMQTV